MDVSIMTLLLMRSTAPTQRHRNVPIHPAMAIFEGRPKVDRWWRALVERDSVRGSAPHDLREQFHKIVGRDRGGYRSVVGARIAA